MGKAKYDWPTIREDYIVLNTVDVFEGRPRTTMKELAEKHGVNYQVLRNRAAREGWDKMLVARSQHMERVASERERRIVERLRSVVEIDELEVRRRHLAIAKMGLAKAAARLDAIKVNDPEKPIEKQMTITEAIRLVDLMLTEERRAVGLGESFDRPRGVLGGDGEEVPEITPDEAKKVFADMASIIDGEFTEVKDSGGGGGKSLTKSK